MANMTGVTAGAFSSNPSAFKQLDPAKYIALGDFIDEVNKPDNREKLVKSFGAQGITGFLQLVGAVKNQGTNDEVQYWEEDRLHQMQAITAGVGGIAAAKTQTLPFGAAAKFVRVNDVVLLAGKVRALVTSVTANNFVVANLKDVNLPLIAEGTYSLPIIGNLFAQGSDQQTEYLESNLVKRTNGYMIIKDIFKVTGSQATNIGWVDLGAGDYRWFIKGETDTRERYIDKREMMMLMAENANHSAVTNLAINGSEGYFSAIENRGLVTDGYINDLADLDAIVKELDKQGAGNEYALYIDRTQDLLIDDLVAKGNSGSLTAGVAEQYGAFNNSKETAVNLGFRSFGRGGYTFHKHDWKLLNDPTLLAGANFAGVAIPLATVVDPKTGDRNPSLEINYKASNGYSREMEHWITGSILGAKNDTKDVAQFNYRSEINLVTRAANRHMLIKKAA
jgi:hypothetical protein